MPGIVIPSTLEKEVEKTRKTLADLSDKGKWGERGIHRIGDGLKITKEGSVVVENRSDAPTQTEQEEMADMFLRFAGWLKSEGASEIAAEKSDTEAVEQSDAAKVPEGQIVQRATDPAIIIPGAGITPADLAYEFGTPIDTTEIIKLCEDTGLYEALPEIINGSKTETWREMTALVNCSGTAYIGFAAGECPDFLCDTSTTETVDKKHIGKMQTLSESDIQHSIASIAAGYGVRELIGPFQVQGNKPNIYRESIKSLMDKEVKKLNILIINGLDYLLVKGNATSRPNEFDGFENYITAANGARSNVLQAAYSGTFSATRFDEWIAAGCVKPTHIFGHPTALQQVKLGYWGLGAATNSNAQLLNFTGPGSNVVAGLTFADVIQTAIGPVELVCDSRFTRTEHAATGEFSSTLFPVRMVHNGEPLIYRGTQIPLSYKELAPGCSAISFLMWTVTALVVKAMCFHGLYTSRFQGKVGDGCSYVFG